MTPIDPENPENPEVVKTTPGQTKKLLRLRTLASEILELTKDLEHELVDKAALKRLTASLKPSPEHYAKAAAARRRKGLD